MDVFLLTMNGPKKGLKFRIHEGFTIGRKSGDLKLEEDSKVSSVHAKVTLDNKGQFILVDQGSSNAMVIQQRRVKKIALMPGIIFRIGDTLFKVHQEERSRKPSEPFKKSEESVRPAESIPAPEDMTQAPAKPKSWRELLKENLAVEGFPFAKYQDGQVEAFSPAIMLDFIEGLQADQKITLGYGPREAGHAHLDIDLIDPHLPATVFQLSPGPGLVQIRDLTGGDLLINNRSIEVTFLEEGDIIGIGQTKIKVRYL